MLRELYETLKIIKHFVAWIGITFSSRVKRE